MEEVVLYFASLKKKRMVIHDTESHRDQVSLTLTVLNF